MGTRTIGDRSVELFTFPKLLQGDTPDIGADVAPAVGLDAKKSYGNDAGSAQCGDHCQRRSGPGSPGRKLTVTAAGAPLPATLVGRVPPDVAMVPVTAMVALHASPGTAGRVGTTNAKLPAAPWIWGAPSTTPQPDAPAAGAGPTSRATEATVRVPPATANAAASRPNLPRTWILEPDMAPSLAGSPLMHWLCTS